MMCNKCFADGAVEHSGTSSVQYQVIRPNVVLELLSDATASPEIPLR
jgi:hypothetical protein